MFSLRGNKALRRLALLCCLGLFGAVLCGCHPAEGVSSAGGSSTGESSVGAVSSSGAVSSAEGSQPTPAADVLRPDCEMDDTIRTIGLCVSEWQDYTGRTGELQQRFSVYKEAGFKTLRIGIEWRNIEPAAEGVFDTPMLTYMIAAKNAGMRFKMVAGTIMGVPQWYYDKFPDAYMVNHNGVAALNTPSYFAPELRTHLENALRGTLEYLKSTTMLDQIDSIVVDCGPAGEPLYPPAWTQQVDGLDNPSGEEAFWGYDVYSQQNFRQTMEAKYGTIAAANAAWGTSYGSFTQVEVPKPGHGGGIWADYLYWYRDAKRDFVTAQVEMYQRLVNEYSGGRIKLILYIPGSDVTDAAFEQAAQSGNGDGNLRIMCDSRFLIDTAKQYGLYLQYTGFENAEQTAYLRAYMDATGAGSIPFFGENAGGYDAVKNGNTLLSIIRRNGMAGIDVTHSRWLFDGNSTRPTGDFAYFQQTMLRLISYLSAEG